jgi:DNA polymerase-4
LRCSTEAVDAALLALVDCVTRRMRAKGLAGRTVVLRLRFADYTRATRSQTLPRATAATRTVPDTGRALLAEARPTIDRRGLTLIRVTVANLDPRAHGRQLGLPLEGPWLDALDAVVDEVRTRIPARRADAGHAAAPRRLHVALALPGRGGAARVPIGPVIGRGHVVLAAGRRS